LKKVLCVSALMAVLFASNHVAAQTAPNPSNLPDAPSATKPAEPAKPIERPLAVAGFPKRVLIDEVKIIKSPLSLRSSDMKWLVPLTGATVVAFTTDHQAMSEVVTSNPSFNNMSTNASNALVGSLIAVPVAMFGAGAIRHDDHARETGMLGGEAITDAYLLGEVIKLFTFRERPTVDNAHGDIFVGSAGIDSSFPSQHALIAWSSAAVLAGEYPNLWVQISAYTIATGVSVTRVLGQQHFPSDVLVGAAAGWLIGRSVYRARHHDAHRPHAANP
jgi:membrane-associated phospholipid phosphatase